MTVSLTTGAARAPLADRKNDLYETPPVAVRALMAVERLPHRVWEPACGPGAIVRVLRGAGHGVIATDLVDYASPDQDEARRDFLMEMAAPNGVQAIVTNPPFKLGAEFVEHALRLVPEVHCLLRLAFLESAVRSPILDSGDLRAVRPFAKRLPAMHRDGWTGPRTSSAMAFAWFSWRRGWGRPATIERLHWDKLEVAE